MVVETDLGSLPLEALVHHRNGRVLSERGNGYRDEEEDAQDDVRDEVYQEVRTLHTNQGHTVLRDRLPIHILTVNIIL